MSRQTYWHAIPTPSVQTEDVLVKVVLSGPLRFVVWPSLLALHACRDVGGAVSNLIKRDLATLGAENCYKSANAIQRLLLANEP